MKYTALVLILLLMIPATALTADPVKTSSLSFKFVAPDHTGEQLYHLNRYMLIHHLYMDMFFRFNLVGRISTEDKIKIYRAIEKTLSTEYPVGVSFPNYQDGQQLTFSLRGNKIKGQATILLFANYNFSTNKIIIDKNEMADAYARLYYVFDDKLVNSHQLFNKEQEQELLGDKENPSLSKNNLADMYLFDEAPENDGAVETLLLEAVNAAKTKADRIVPKMTLIQYYLFINKPDKVPPLLKECETLLAQEKDKQNFQEFLSAMEEEYLIYLGLKQGT